MQQKHAEKRESNVNEAENIPSGRTADHTIPLGWKLSADKNTDKTVPTGWKKLNTEDAPYKVEISENPSGDAPQRAEITEHQPGDAPHRVEITDKSLPTLPTGWLVNEVEDKLSNLEIDEGDPNDLNENDLTMTEVEEVDRVHETAKSDLLMRCRKRQEEEQLPLYLRVQ